jgi:alkyl hydroperoxide reductase subunit D
MPRFAPLAAPDERTAMTFERLAEFFGDRPVPAPFLLYARCPAFLQDFYMNFKKHCLSDGKLDLKTKALVCLAVAGNSGCQPWADFFADRVREHGGDDQTLADVAGVASACSMYNVFFKFRDLSGSDLFSGMAVGLRAHTFGNTSLDERTVELINVALSDINGCKPCTSGHVEKARALGVSDDAIHETVQCAATLTAGIQFLKHAG